MQKLRLLVVDDDDLIHQSIRMAIADQWSVTSAYNLGEIKDQKYHAAFVDMHLSPQMEKQEGVEVVSYLNKKYPHLDIVAMSGDLNRKLMEDCLRVGASRFLAKPLSVDEVHLTLEKIEGHILLTEASQRGNSSQSAWIGSSKKSDEIRRRVAELRGESGPILIEGESGCGKEVVAGLIHGQGTGGPFIRVNVGAMPENLFESEIFGHVKGAFTGADQNKMGLAEAAHQGDLFLDEIEALSLPLQVKLLRFLETGEIRRVGSNETIKVNVRTLAATNRSLEAMAKNGEFREDLLWRINGKKISLPPLRDRLNDIEDLAQYFITQDKVRNKKFDSDALAALKGYSWPGNVRELRRVCEQLLFQSPLPFIRAEDVVAALNLNIGPEVTFSNPSDESMVIVDVEQQGLAAVVNAFEARIISKCLDAFNDMDEVVKKLKISRSSLYKKIKDYEIDWRK